MSYEKPQVVDYGDLQEMTQATGILGAPDGTGFTIQVVVDPIIDLSIGLGG